MSEEKKEKRATHDVKPEDVRVGHIMAMTYYVKVREVKDDGTQLIVDGLTKNTPKEFEVRGKSLITGCTSADQYHEEVQVSASKAAEILTTSYNLPLTVCFTKKDGSQRTLRGKLLGEEPHMGYSWVEDLERPENDRVREVNHREIRWLVVNGVKYQVKGRK